MVNKSEFCQFSLTGKIQFLVEYGELLYVKSFKRREIKIYRLQDFYVQVVLEIGKAIGAEVFPTAMLWLFKDENK